MLTCEPVDLINQCSITWNVSLLYFGLYTYIHVMYMCNTFTPQIKGICYGLNVMCISHITALQECYNFHWNVLQLPIRMHIIMLQLPMACCKNTYQGALIKIPKNIDFYKAQHVDIVKGFELRSGLHLGNDSRGGQSQVL